ncbi:MAG: MFS transporter, partial [Terricaulis sp.]
MAGEAESVGEAPSWIGARPSASQISALMFCGVVGLMIPGLQPLLLGAFAEEGRLGAEQLGQVATAELFAMGLTAGLAGCLLKATRLKLVA